MFYHAVQRHYSHAEKRCRLIDFFSTAKYRLTAKSGNDIADRFLNKSRVKTLILCFFSCRFERFRVNFTKLVRRFSTKDEFLGDVMILYRVGEYLMVNQFLNKICEILLLCIKP